MPRILIVEDDRNLREAVATALQLDGHDTFDAASGAGAVCEVVSRRPDLILLDLGLPDANGLQVLRSLRQRSIVPIIVVSGWNDQQLKVCALDAGANDYVTKPFSPAELRARVRARLRCQARPSAPSPPAVHFGECTFAAEAGLLVRAGKRVRLSAIELKLLQILARNADRVVATEALLRHVWGVAYQRRNAYVRIYVHALRAKIESDPSRPRHVLTTVGAGYRLRTTRAF